MALERYPLVSALLAAVVVHGAILLAAQAEWQRLDRQAFQSADSREYYDLAMSIATQGVFVREGRPEAWRTPGYPAFLALMMWMIGTKPVALILAQQALGVLNAVLLARAVTLLSGPRRGMLAALLFLLEPYHHYYGMWLMSTTLFTTCLLVMWSLWIRMARTGRVLDAAGLGLLCGLAVLIRPLAVAMPPALAVAALLCGRRVPRRACAQAAALLATACALPAAWMLRNERVNGHVALSAQGGPVLAYFKATEVQLWRQGRAGERYVETSLNPDRDSAAHTVWDDIDRELRVELFDPLVAYPGLDEDLRRRLRDLLQAQDHGTAPATINGPAPRLSDSPPAVWQARLDELLAERQDIAADRRARIHDGFLQLHALGWRQLARGTPGAVEPFLAARGLRRVGRRMLLESPLATLGCCLWRCGVLLSTPLNLAVSRYTGVDSGGTRHWLLGAVYAALSAWVAWRVLLGAGGAGAAYPLACVAALLLASTPQIDPRLRVPMIPLLLCLAVLPGKRMHRRGHAPRGPVESEPGSGSSCEPQT